MNELNKDSKTRSIKVSEEAWRRLKYVNYKTGVTLKDLLIEAINALADEFDQKERTDSWT